MKARIVFLACLAVMVLGLAMPAWATPDFYVGPTKSNSLTVTSPANCRVQAKQSVRNETAEIRIKVRCDAEETISIMHSEFELIALNASHGRAVMVEVPSGYTFQVPSNDQSENKRIHVLVMRLPESERLPAVQKGKWHPFGAWWFIKKRIELRIDAHRPKYYPE